MVPKLRSSSRQKPLPNIASDQLAKDHRNGKKASKNAHGSKSIQAEEQGTKDICIHEGIGGNRDHVLVVHFGESKWEEIDFRGKISFLDVLNICKKFVDIYSVGIVISDWHGRPLKNDRDLQCLLKEQEHVENISIYLDVDETAQPLAFELPRNNPLYACVPESSQVRDVATEDDISNETESETGFESESETGFESESESESEAEYEIVSDNLRNNMKDPASEKLRNVRGKNKNKKILALKDGEKLEIQFYNYRGVGPNHECWSRHLGKIVRDRHICPVQVLTWKEMPDVNKKLMWFWATEYFSNPDMESYRDHTLEHMGALWTSWRSLLHVKYMKPCETIELALKNVPPGMDVQDWEWLVTEKFLIPEPEAGYTTEPEAAYTTETNNEQDEEPCVPNLSQVEDATTEDDISSETGSETESDNIGKNMEDSVPEKLNNKTLALKCGEKLEKVRKGRGKNKNTKILALKDGEKLEIQFYINRGVGPNHKCWSRHLGKIVRDGHICPVRVHTWKEMPYVNKQHMWDWVKEYFSNPDMELYREHTLEHMGSLWTKWRSLLNHKYMKPCETIELALKNVPPGMDDKDWEWLVTEKFSSDEFQELSARNSNNRANVVMPHRTGTGSLPYRQVIYEMVDKADTPSNVAKIFYATRHKNGKLDTRDKEKYDEIVKTVQDNPSLSPIEIIDTCFGPLNDSDRKRKKRKRSTEHKSAYVKKLEAKIHEQDEERKILIERLEQMEHRLIRMENGSQPTSNVLTACGSDQPTSNDLSTFGDRP